MKTCVSDGVTLGTDWNYFIAIDSIDDCILICYSVSNVKFNFHWFIIHATGLILVLTRLRFQFVDRNVDISLDKPIY